MKCIVMNLSFYSFLTLWFWSNYAWNGAWDKIVGL
uniref:Uncharacterized protein n=1 Tax=Rhizophora mucronata TaxID=61149 RepID=A0A2P2MNN7_RHIMU